ncbi:hypothetical protein FQN55_000307 [Onygenales sp. PD_40]|nr:hypothetical protein FQN55_000307 [Onygenales sp. PD_40]
MVTIPNRMWLHELVVIFEHVYRVPPNVKFYVDNVEAQWTNEQPYDFVHVRYMAASIKD